MPSALAFEVMKHIQQCKVMDFYDFKTAFPDYPPEILIDLARDGYLEDAEPGLTAAVNLTGGGHLYEYASYRLSDKGRAFLADHPKKVRREKASEFRAWFTLVVAVLALLLSLASIGWQIYTWKTEKAESKDPQTEAVATMGSDAQGSNHQGGS